MLIPPEIKKELGNKSALAKLQHLTPSEGELLLQKTPEWIRDKMYARCCSRQECQELADSWADNPDRINNLNHQLKKNRRGFQVIASSNLTI